jgi:type VI secretion system secreted protein VgrG
MSLLLPLEGSAAMPHTQDNRLLAVKTPLGKDVLLLYAFSGREELSRLFRYDLDMLSEKGQITAKDIVGKPVTWQVNSPAATGPRYFHGHVSRFVAGAVRPHGLRHYQAEVVPWLWFLTRTTDCRIFQNQTAPDIIEKIFKDLGFSDYQRSLRGSYSKREYCVQYRETDFAFVSRLMEQEGIFYFFRHENGKHTLVLADQKGAFQDCPEKEVAYEPGSLDPDHVSRWEHAYEFRSGKWAQTDYNFETPSTELMTRSTTVVSLTDNKKFEHYDYPGAYRVKANGEGWTKVRMEEEEAPYDVVSGASTCRTFTPGGKFTLKKHTCDGEAGKGYAITSIEHRASDDSYEENKVGAAYGNTFTCIPDSVNFRPARRTPRPVVQGPQTAVVVGTKGEEIYTDKYGRVKVQFFWDREGKKDENSSCWIRVAQNWAGKNWGIVFHPRIGQEVVVDFLEGDPDRPLITGRVYNAEQMPPYELPANQTQSVLKTRSSKGGGTDNFNELRFEDKKGSEDIFFHAEKDFHREVEHDDDLKVGHDQTIEVKNDRTETVKEGNEKVTVKKGNRTVIVDTGNDTHQVKKGNREVSIDTGNDTLKVKTGNREVSIDTGNDTLTIKTGNLSIKANLGKIEVEAMQSIQLKVGQSSIKIDQAGVTIQGMTIKIQGQIQTQVKGLITQVSGDALLQLKGGVIMIG